MAYHNTIVGNDLHTLIFRHYPSAVERVTDVTLVAADVGKLTMQDDSASFWMLRSVSPVTWENFGTDSSARSSADFALGIAIAGTNAANQAYSVARTALDTAWVGTTSGDQAYSLARLALDTAWAGTNQPAVDGVYAVARTALDTAWVGTMAAEQADSLARTALNTAWLGTVIPALSELPDVDLPLPLAGQTLHYDGVKWISAYSGVEASHAAFTYYLDGTDISHPGYELLTGAPMGGVEVLETATGLTTGSGPKLIDQYISGTFGRTVLDAGVWGYNTYGKATGANCFITVKTYVLSGFAETHLWDTTTPVLPTSVSLVASEVFGTLVPVLPSDRLLLRYYGRHVGGSSETVTLYHNGYDHYTHVHTPLAVLHNELPGLQGGQAGQYYHLTEDERNAISGAAAPSASNVFVTTSVAQVIDTTADQAYSLAQQALLAAWAGTNNVSSGTGAGYNGTLTLFAAQVPGWKADVQLTLIGGVLVGYQESRYSIDQFAYNVGPIGTITGDLGGGSSWNGTGRIAGPYSTQDAAVDRQANVGLSGGAYMSDFVCYGTWGVNLFALPNGTNWSEPWVVNNECYHIGGTESFESFSTGVVYGTNFTAAIGYGWSGTVGFY